MSNGWDDILDPDETIIWQGRPDGAFRLTFGSIAMAAFGTFFAGFALVWMFMASMGGGYFWMFGLIHFAVGVGIIVGAFVTRPLKNRRTWYSLSNKRAFIATNFPILGRRLRSFPIGRDTSLSLDESALDSVYFATETYQKNNRTRTRRVGFEAIKDGTEVYRIMRDMQRRDRQEEHT
jgi:hypothetical protein